MELSSSLSLVECAYCRVDLRRCGQVLCCRAQCGVKLCASCFSVGVRIAQHRPWHPYRVNTNLSFPVFAADWSAQEELVLLAAIAQYGLGNWRDVAEHFPSKSDRRCAEHFWDRYTGRFGGWLPPETFDRHGNLVETATLASAEAVGREAHERERFAPLKRTAEGEGPPETPEAPPAVAGSLGDSVQSKAAAMGYTPLRGDFDLEHEEDAEELLADMVFEEGESDLDVELKLQVIRIFNRKLDDRQRRKDFVVERKFLDYQGVLKAEASRPREERDLRSQLRPLARFQSAEEHSRFIKSLLRTERLKKRIEELQYYRSVGVRPASDVLPFEEESKRKMKEEEDEKRRRESDAAPHLFCNAVPEDQHLAQSGSAVDDKVQILAKDERMLCADLKVSAAAYLALKGTVLGAYVRSGQAEFSLEDAKATKAGAGWTDVDAQIFNFITRSGWLSLRLRPPVKRRRMEGVPSPMQDDVR